MFTAATLLFACGDDASDPEPTPPRDAGRDASRDAGRDSGRDAEVLPVEDASQDEEPDARVVEEDASTATPDAGLDCSPPADGVLPRNLHCTGLYKSGTELADGLVQYTPKYVLWSDDAEKRRFVSLPPGTKVDVSNPDAFVYPEGTKFWKEFSVRGSDGVSRRAETRLLQKGPDGWLYTSYVWNAAETQALQMDNTNGVPDLKVGGTSHIVPTRDQCNECHGGRDDQILGWDAIMLDADGTGVTPEWLAPLIEGELPRQIIPGNAVEKAALGYLHANCGISCHNDNPAAKARDSGLFLRLEVGELSSVRSTDAWKAINKQPSPNAKLDGLPTIQGSWVGIRPGDPDRSLLIARQRIRGFESQMPRIGTNIVDEQGTQTVADWIKAMPANTTP
ncbi:MAG: hypothetical protein ABW352_25205 [Polyangiales bacterium]